MSHSYVSVFFFNDPATTEIYTLSLHDALPISPGSARRSSRSAWRGPPACGCARGRRRTQARSEEHTSELQSLRHLVCRLLLEKKKKTKYRTKSRKTEDRITLSSTSEWCSQRHK